MKKPSGHFLSSEFLLQCTLFSGLAIYLQTVNFTFVYDDFAMIVMNRWMESWHGLPQMFLHHSWAFSDTYQPARHYRPVFLVWLWMVQHVFSASPGWFHLCSIFTHLLAVYLAYRVAMVLLKDPLGASMAALLFAVHPTKVESVSWIAAATEPLMAVFFFAAFLAYLRWRESTRRGWIWALASFVCALAALLTKETAVVLPGVILAYELLLGSWREKRPSWPRLAGLISPFVLADATWLLMRSLVFHGAGAGDVPASMKSTLLTAPVALWLYIRQLVWPVNLSALYPETAVTQFSVMHTVLPVAGLVVLGAGYWMWARHRPVLQFAAIWFLFTLAPVVAGFSWVQLHDRHLYLPSFGVALAAAVAMRQLRWPGAANREQAQVAATLAIALVLAGISAGEARVWDSELTVFTRAVSVSPLNAEAVDMLAHAQCDNGHPELALQTLNHALELQPESERLMFSLGSQYFHYADYADARPLLEKLARSGNRDYRASALYDLSVLEMRQNHLDAAESLLNAAIQAAPNVAGFRRAMIALQHAKAARAS